MNDLDKEFDSLPNLDDEFDSLPETQPREPDAMDSVLDTGKDTLLGSVQGLTLGGADEIEGAVKAGGELLSGDAALYDNYRKYQQLAEKRYKEASERSPIAYTAGTIGGAVLPAIATGGAGLAARAGLSGAARVGAAVAEGGALGALSGGLSSEANLDTIEGAKNLAADTVIGGGVGATLGGTLSGAGEALKGSREWLGKVVDDTPFLRQQVKLPFALGKGGKDISSEAVQMDLMQNPTRTAKDLLGRIKETDSKLGEAVSGSLDKATQAGKKLNFSQDLLGSFSELEQYAQQNPDIALEKLAKKTYSYLKNKGGPVSPLEAKQMLTEMQDIGESLKGETGPAAAFLRDQVHKIKQTIDMQLKSEIPEYATAAKRFNDFRNNVSETIMSGATPRDISGATVGGSRNPDKKIFDSLKATLEGSGREGSGFFDQRIAMENMKKGLQSFEKNEAGRLASKQIDELIPGLESGKTMKTLRDVADESAMLQTAAGVTGHEGIQSSAMKGALGVAKAGKGAVALASNKVGRLSGSKPVQLAQSLYKAPAEALESAAETLKQTKGLEFLGKALDDGIKNGDRAKQNAAIFSILQNPEARKLLAPDEQE